MAILKIVEIQLDLHCHVLDVHTSSRKFLDKNPIKIMTLELFISQNWGLSLNFLAAVQLCDMIIPMISIHDGMKNFLRSGGDHPCTDVAASLVQFLSDSRFSCTIFVG